MAHILRTLIVLFLFFWPTDPQAQSLPDHTELYVNDFAQLLSSSEAEEIREKLVELRDARGIEFTLVTIQSVRDFGYAGPIEPFATDLFNHWGVGDADRDDGLMMLVALLDRNIRIEVGSGYGSRQDSAMKNIIEDDILPHFRNSDYFTGINDGVDNVIHQVTGEWPDSLGTTGFQKIGSKIGHLIREFWGWLAAGAAAAFGAMVQLYHRWKRNRPRICPRDGAKMHRLAEDWDDRYLQDGQVKEETLESVDYDVWECPECQNTIVEGYKAWFTRYGACRKCGYRTVEGTSTVVTPATYESSGQRRIDYHCHFCGDEYTAYKTIPRKTKSSSSSSSFGGGSSSGGGASGSW